MRSDVSLAANSMTIMLWPCKNMHHLAGKTCPLGIGGGGTYVDADWEELTRQLYVLWGDGPRICIAYTFTLVMSSAAIGVRRLAPRR